MHLPFISKVNALNFTSLHLKYCRNDSGNVELLIIYNFIDSFRNLFSLVEIQYT